MPDVFTDFANNYDLTITTTADWTVSSGGMPNGDNYVTADGTVASTYNVNGDDFNFVDGTAWTFECWVWYSVATAVDQDIVVNSDPAAAATSYAWRLRLTSSEQLNFDIGSTAPGSHLLVGTGILAASTWHHIVVIKSTGNQLDMYRNNVLVSTDTTTTGTAQAPTSAYRITIGSHANGSNDMGASSSDFRLAHLAIYNAALTTDQINDHYLAMTAV